MKLEEAKERFILGAWVGFQLGAGGDKTFKQYLEGLGLGEKQTETIAEPPEITAKAAIAKAEEILRMAREKKK